MVIQAGKVVEDSIYSTELNETMKLLVYLPYSYSPLYKYNLLIAQDGHDYFRLGRIGRQIDQLLKNGEIEQTIVVGVPYKNVEDRREKYHPSGLKFSAYKRFLAHELVPYLDREFPTLQLGSSRGLIGDSLAATISLMTAIQYPNIFGKVIMQSPLVNDNVLRAIEQFHSTSLPSLYHQIGIQENAVKTTNGEIVDFITPNRQLKKVIENKGIPYKYEEFEGDHKWTYWQPLMKTALKEMFS